MLYFFHSLEGFGTFGTSHLPRGVENSHLSGGVSLSAVGTRHPSGGVQLPAGGTYYPPAVGNSHPPGGVQLPAVGTSCKNTNGDNNALQKKY